MTLAVVFPLIAWMAQFDSATVTANHSGASSSKIDLDNGTLSVVNASLKACIRFAYDVKDYQVDGPAWIDSSRYDIRASGPRPKDEAEAARMLQALLADRFKLKLHYETETIPVYELIVAAGGARLKPAQTRGENDRLTNTRLSAQGIGMAQLAELLSRRLDRPVVDKTGLSGAFDLELDWTAGSLPTALPEQLGLKLEQVQEPVDILVIDHAEQPDAN